MSIELKQAAQRAVDAFHAFGDADDFASLFELTQKMRALRTAIQQADAQPDNTACRSVQKRLAAQQPATGEPVVPDGVWEALQRLIENGSMLGKASADDALLVAKHRKHLLTTHPAPSVPDAVVHLRNALILAANRLDRLTLELKYDSQARADAIEWAGDAMLAAKDHPSASTSAP